MSRKGLLQFSFEYFYISRVCLVGVSTLFFLHNVKYNLGRWALSLLTCGSGHFICIWLLNELGSGIFRLWFSFGYRLILNTRNQKKISLFCQFQVFLGSSLDPVNLNPDPQPCPSFLKVGSSSREKVRTAIVSGWIRIFLKLGSGQCEAGPASLPLSSDPIYIPLKKFDQVIIC